MFKFFFNNFCFEECRHFAVFSLTGWARLLWKACLKQPKVFFLIPPFLTLHVLILPVQCVVQVLAFINGCFCLYLNRSLSVGSVKWKDNKPVTNLLLCLIWYAPIERGHNRARTWFTLGKGIDFSNIFFFCVILSIFRFLVVTPTRVFWQTALACSVAAYPSQSSDGSFANFVKELAMTTLLDATGSVRSYP